MKFKESLVELAKEDLFLARFWLDFGSISARFWTQIRLVFGWSNEPSQPLQITELERAELILKPKFSSLSEPSQMFNSKFRARASRAVSSSAGSSQNSSRAVACSTSNIRTYAFIQTLARNVKYTILVNIDLNVFIFT